MVTVRCDNKKCKHGKRNKPKLFNKTPSKVKRDRFHFCCNECKHQFRGENEYLYSSHKMNKEPAQRIRQWAQKRNEIGLNDFDHTIPLYSR